jgi:hypothetical protein
MASVSLVRSFIGAAVLAAAACGGRSSDAGDTAVEPGNHTGVHVPCGNPDMTYACSPVARDASGCAGPTGDGGFAIYPTGCVARLPGCGAAAVAHIPVSCTCMTNVLFGDGGPGWICPE